MQVISILSIIQLYVNNITIMNRMERESVCMEENRCMRPKIEADRDDEARQTRKKQEPGRAHGESLIGVRILADGAGEECLVWR